MDKPFKCPHCGSAKYKLLKQPNVLECLGCGRSHAYDVAWPPTPAPTEHSKPSE